MIQIFENIGELKVLLIKKNSKVDYINFEFLNHISHEKYQKQKSTKVDNI